MYHEPELGQISNKYPDDGPKERERSMIERIVFLEKRSIELSDMLAKANESILHLQAVIGLNGPR